MAMPCLLLNHASKPWLSWILLHVSEPALEHLNTQQNTGNTCIGNKQCFGYHYISNS